MESRLLEGIIYEEGVITICQVTLSNDYGTKIEADSRISASFAVDKILFTLRELGWGTHRIRIWDGYNYTTYSI